MIGGEVIQDPPHCWMPVKLDGLKTKENLSQSRQSMQESHSEPELSLRRTRDTSHLFDADNKYLKKKLRTGDTAPDEPLGDS